MTTVLKLKVYGEKERYVGSFQKEADFVPSVGDLIRPFYGSPDLECSTRTWCVGLEGRESLSIVLKPVFKDTRDEYGWFVSGLANYGWRKDDGK